VVPGSRDTRDEERGSSAGNIGTTVESCYAAGLAALDHGAIEEARQWAQRCESAPNAAGDPRCAALHGAIAAEAGDHERAAAHFRRAAESKPGDALVARQVSEALAAQGALEEAAVLLERAAQYDRDDPNLLVDLGYLRMTSGDETAARSALERAAALRPGDADIARYLAQAYEALGDLAQAVAGLAIAAQQRPSPRVLTDLARLYLRLERYADAEAAFGALDRLDPEHRVFAHHGLTWCRIKRRDWRGALDVALGTTRLDRFDLTTAFLAYARDGLFGTVAEEKRQEADLAARFLAELQEHDELHRDDVTPVAVEEQKGG